MLLEAPLDRAREAPETVTRTERIQDALLELLDGQLVIRRRAGQSVSDAIKEAKADRAKLLADLRQERENRRVGPATESAFGRFQELYQQRALRSTRGITVTLEEALTDSGFEKFQRQENAYKEVKRRTREVQEHLINFIPEFVKIERRAGERIEPYTNRLATEHRKKAEEIRAEQEQGIWGPRSRAAYRQYQKWFHEEGLPDMMGALDSLKLRWPVGCPEQLRMGSSERAENPELFRALLAARKRIPVDNSDPATALEYASYRALHANSKWYREAADAVFLALVKSENDRIRQVVIDQKLPKEWLEGAEADPKRWRVAAGPIVDLYVQAGNLLEAMDHLHRATKGNFPLIPPPGTEFLCKDGRFRSNPRLDDIDRNPDPDDTIKHFRLRKPANLRLDDRATWETIQELRQWANVYKGRIEDGIITYGRGLANPERLLSFTNLEMHGNLARINANGELVGIALPGQPNTVPGETRVPFNLIETRCEVRVARDGPNQGHVVVVQTADAYQVPWWGYQNWRGQHVASVPPVEMRLDRSKFYGVLCGGKIELVRGDKLASALNWQRRWLRLEQIATPALDGALAAATLGESFAATSAARVAGAGARLTAGQKIWESARLSLQATMIGAGIGNSAGGRESEFGRFVHDLRGKYFLCDITRGIGQGAGLIPHSAAALKIQKAIEAYPWLKSLHTQTARGAMYAECCLVPLIGRGLIKLGATALGTGGPNLLEDASEILGDGVNLKPPERDSFNMRNPEILRRENAIIDRYATVLQDGRDPETRRDVERILKRVNELLAADANPSEREKFKKEMLAYFLPQPRTLSQFISKHQFSDSDFRSLHDPNQLMHRWAETGVAAAVHRRNTAVGPDRRAAAAIALLTLSRKPDGTVPSELVSETRTYRGGGPARQYTVGISFQELVGYLNRDLALPNQRGRDIFVGEVLVRYGAMTGQQYAATLLRNLEAPSGSGRNNARDRMLARNRMAALSDPFFPRMATIIDGLRGLDQVGVTGEKSWQGFGVTASALMDALRKRARTDPDTDVRAMSAMLLLGLNHPDRRAGLAVLQENNARWHALSTRAPGTYANEVRQYLERQTRVDIPAAAPPDSGQEAVRQTNQRRELACAARLNAVLQLAELSDANNNKQQKAIAQMIASCWSETSANVSVKVLDALLPHRIKLLSEAELASLRTNAVALLSVPELPQQTHSATPRVIGPEQREQAAAMVRLIQQLQTAQLLGEQNGALVRTFCTKLEQMIDPRTPRGPQIGDETYGNYRNQFKPASALPSAQLFPELMAEAITALARHNSQSSIPLIRARLTGEAPSFDTNRGPQPYEPVRPEPSLNAEGLVVIAAARALAHMNYRPLSQVLPPLIRTQRDPEVAQVLRDVQVDFPPGNPPDRVLARRIVFERASLEYLGVRLPNESAGKDYLKRKQYSLLNGVTYRDAVRAAAGSVPGATGWATWPFGVYEAFNSVMETARMEAVVSKFRERNVQWNALVAMARRFDSNTKNEAGKAKAALSWILLHNGHSDDLSISPPNDSQPGVRGAGLLSGDGKSWVLRSANALVDILANGEDRDKTAYIIATALKNDSVDPEAKLILLRGLRWMYEESNKLVANLGPGSGASQQHRELLGFHRQGLAKIVGDTLATERGKALGATGPESLVRERLRTELLNDFVRFGARTELSEILLASALHDPSQSIKNLAWQKFYERRDAVGPVWQAIPNNRNPNWDYGINQVTAAHGAWSRNRDNWMQYLSEFKGFVEHPRREGQNPPLVPASAEQRDALAHAIISGFKGCKFDGRNRALEAQALELLSMLMDDPDGKIRLAASKILMESTVPLHDPVKRKAITACINLLGQNDNPQYKLDAAAQLASARLPRRPENFWDALNTLSVLECRDTLSVLKELKRHHPQAKEKAKAAAILEQFWPQHIQQILRGNVRITADQLRADDPVLPMLLQSIRNDRLPEEQRLRAAVIWLPINHGTLVSKADLETALNAVRNIALTSTNLRIRDEAAKLITESLRLNVSYAPQRGKPGWVHNLDRQELLLKAVADVKHPGGMELLDWVARERSSSSNLPRMQATDLLVAQTLSTITQGLKARPQGAIPFRPLLDADDPRMFQLLFNIGAGRDAQVKISSVYAYLVRESTGASQEDKHTAVRQLIKLSTNETSEIKRQATWIFQNLDRSLANPAIDQLLAEFDRVRERKGTHLDRTLAMIYCLHNIANVARHNLPDAQGQMLLFDALKKGQQHCPGANAALGDIAGILMKAMATNSIEGEDGNRFLIDVLSHFQRHLPPSNSYLRSLSDLAVRTTASSTSLAMSLLGNSDQNISLTAALSLVNNKSRMSAEAQERVFTELAYLGINGDGDIRTRAGARFGELERTNPQVCVYALNTVLDRLGRATYPDADKINACRTRIAKLRRQIKETYQPDERQHDAEALLSRDPSVTYSRLALRHHLETLREKVREHGEDSVEVGRSRLTLAKIYYAISQHSPHYEIRTDAMRQAEQNAKLAERTLRARLGNDSSEVADANYRLGLMYLNANHPETAGRYFSESSATYKRAGAERHANALAWINSHLFLCYIERGNAAAAQACQQQLIDQAKELSSSEVQALARNLNILSGRYDGRRGKRNDSHAESVLKLALAVCDANNVTKETLSSGIMVSLADTLALQGKHNEALPLFVGAIKFFERNQIQYAGELEAALNLYGNSLEELGRSAEAQRARDRAAVLARRSRPPA
jgi:hypothetical protein